MKNRIFILALFALLFICGNNSAWSANKKYTVMEMLINKDWHEVNMSRLETHEHFYVRYTGTQRLTVGVDQEGNMKAKVQEYYLSNKYESKFDPKKVGKNQDGKYLIIRRPSTSKSNQAICLRIEGLTEGGMQTVDENHPMFLRKLYYTYDQESVKGKVISTVDLLADKIWYHVDEATGERLRVEQTYNKWYVLNCVMPENRRAELPKWQLNEYYLSDTIVTEFDRNRVGETINGIYLVVNEKEDDGTYQVRNYDISTLSDERLMLDCVYPKGVEARLFENNLGGVGKENVKLKPKQRMLMANKWFRFDTATWERSKHYEYFNKTHVTRMVPVRNDNGVKLERRSFEYYMSNQPETEFDWTRRGKTLEGDYIVVKEPDREGNWRPVNYKIELLNERNLVTVNESSPDSLLFAYERDLNEVEKILLNRRDSIARKGKTMMDMLVGKQWRPVYKEDSTGLFAGRRWRMNNLYFTDSKIGNYSSREKINNVVVDYKIQNFYLSDGNEWDFNYDKLYDKPENGKYLHYVTHDYNGDVIYETWEITYLSETLLVVRKGVRNDRPFRPSDTTVVTYMSQ